MTQADDITIRLAEPSDLDAIARWTVDRCREPGRQCLHSWTSGSEEEAAAELRTLVEQDEIVLLVAERGDRLIGALSAEHDVDLGRGWLRGPHVTDDDWPAVAPRLLAELRPQLPEAVTLLFAYLEVRNERGISFYLDEGFGRRNPIAHELVLPGDVAIEPPATTAESLSPAFEAGFLALFAELFPKTYFTGERLVELNGTSHRILVETEGESEVLGFAVLALDELGSGGELQFVGVAPRARRRGLGRRLVTSTVQRLREEEGRTTLSLNVTDDNAEARALYEQLGFRVQFSGTSLRWTAPSGDD